MTARPLQKFVLLGCLFVQGMVAPAQDLITINERPWHLGREGQAEWEEFAVSPPDALRLDVPFEATENGSESTLFIQQDDVRHDWKVELNGKQLGRLFSMEADLVSSFAVPAGLLKEGENVLSILPPESIDDIRIGRIVLVNAPLGSTLRQALVDIQVIDADSRLPLPARVTIVDERGSLAAMTAGNDEESRPVAVRPGVAYVGPNGASVGLPAGNYTIYAGRGFEYGIATQRIALKPGESKSLQLSIQREVPTPGWVSSDTHVHTLTHSGHGDATIEERMLTLAGENVELPVATDHNVHADFVEPSERLALTPYFTPITGNEVTTATAHFNAFPVAHESRVPDFRIPSWPALIEHVRETTGARVVVLNHPMNVHSKFQPFASTNFNNVTGENLRGPEFTFNAIELLNSSAQQSDFMTVYNGWFAMLNHGYRITGVGSSDGHDVSRYIIGQGRTYIRTDDRDPGQIDVADACDKLLAGRALVSMGLLVDIAVADQFHVGDLATGLSETFDVRAQVLGPAWVSATNVTLYANGIPIRSSTLVGNEGMPGLKATITWQITRPKNDVHLVAIATGPGVVEPYWAIPRPYQPSSRRWVGRVIGSTNPVWVDADGDGEFTAARGFAKNLQTRVGADPNAVVAALASFDETISCQSAGLHHEAGADLDSQAWRDALKTASPQVRRGFEAYFESLP